MSRFEFLGFTATPGEKFLGIASVKINGDFPMLLRYKINMGKNGGYFPSPAAIKSGSGPEGDTYVPCFVIDSNIAKEEIETLIRSSIKPYMASSQNVEVMGAGVTQNLSTANAYASNGYATKDEGVPF